MKLTKKINRYRTLTTWVFCFPDHIDPLRLKFYGYIKNNGVSKMKGLSIWNFESISYTGDRDGYIRAVGLLNGRLESLIFTIDPSI